MSLGLWLWLWLWLALAEGGAGRWRTRAGPLHMRPELVAGPPAPASACHQPCPVAAPCGPPAAAVRPARSATGGGVGWAARDDFGTHEERAA
ncbi:MAG: hypothetical protein RLY78_170, partial [Pseudomonadota bacterium]